MAEHALVLVVDDEPDILHAIAEALEAALDCVVLTAGSGAEALRLLKTAPPETLDLIVSDLRMPAMDGPTFLREAAKTHAATPRILMSAYPENLDDEGRAAGAVLALAKPFRPQDLVEAARGILARRASQRAGTGPG